MTLNNFEIIQKLQTLHFQMTFLLSSTSSLVKLSIISCFPAIANDHKASNGAIHHSCCSVHVIKFFKQSGRFPIELKLCSVTNRQDTQLFLTLFFFFLWLQSTYNPRQTIPIVDTTLLSNYAAQKRIAYIIGKLYSTVISNILIQSLPAINLKDKTIIPQTR